MNIWKILQRQFYDILSNKCYLLIFLLLTYTSVISIFHFCEILLNRKWGSNNKFYVENISGKILQDKLCQYFPIDVVYTWVNGSDPIFIRELVSKQRALLKDLSRTCSMSDCLPSHFTAFKLNSSEFTHVLNELSYLSLKSVTLEGSQWTVLRWDSIKTAEEQADKIFEINARNISPFHVHWTSEDKGHTLYMPKNTIAIKGLNKSLEFISKAALEQSIRKNIASLWRYPHVIFAELNSHSDVDQILKGKKWNIVLKKHVVKLNITRAGLIMEVPSHIHPEDYASSRYEDKEELRYSLRSLEKYAPWVRKIFIVTNGQLPHWLDLSNPRIQIIPHLSIFPNTSHLPTFSSPAIESHLHRIPGLSARFLYFNDDIFLGEDVLPEDFITSRGGQKVYLSWPVPDCSPVCPWSWVGDGTCDTPCNISACDYDGQDCLTLRHKNSHQHSTDDDYPDYPIDFLGKNSKGKFNRTFNLSDYYEEKSLQNFSTASESPISSKSNYTINNDEDLNELLELLMANKSSLTSDVIQDMFILLKTVHVNDTIASNFGGKVDLFEKLLDSLTRKSVPNSLLLNKLDQRIKKIKSNNAREYLKTSNSDRRNLLNFNYLEHRHFPLIQDKVEQPRIKTSDSNNTRQILLRNLSRTQVGVPPLGVAERFYAFQPEISSLQRKLDTFAESLLHVNSLLNGRYGYKTRKVPSHMPHLIDKNIMANLQNTFPKEYERTSSHYFRHPHDMQFSFGYFYFLMNEEVDVPVSEIFDVFDTDGSGTWSDREIRTVLTRLYDLPLQRSSVLNFETALLYCARSWFVDPLITTPAFERYLDSKLPSVTKNLIENCSLVSDLLKRKMGRKKRYLYTLVKPTTREALVGFHMVTSNLSHLLTTLDRVRRKPKKFICLNDNMDATREADNQLIRAVLVDFFHSLFPKPSQFELPPDYRNRYEYYADFVVWQTNKRKISIVVYSILIVVVSLVFFCLFHAECKRFQHKTKRRLQRLLPGFRITKRKHPSKL